MKRIIKYATLFAVLGLWLTGCTKSDKPVVEGQAKLTIATSVDPKVNDKNTRATSTDVRDYTLIVRNTDTKVDVINEKLTVRGEEPSFVIATGTYEVTVTSHPEGIPAPAYDTQVYSDTKTVTLGDGENKQLELVCTQSNAGVFFTYDESLKGRGVVPKIVHPEGTLDYPTDDESAVGYFSPSAVTVSFMLDGQAVKVNGKESQQVTLSAADLWEINLKAVSGTGEFGIIAVVIPVDDPTHREQWFLGDDDGEPDPDVDVELDWFASGAYYGGTMSSEMIIDFWDEEYEHNMYIRLFTEKCDFTNIRIAPGEYTMIEYDKNGNGNNTRPMQFVLGFQDTGGELYPSQLHYYAYSIEEPITGAVIPTSGKITVELDGNIYTVTATFSGIEHDFENKTQTKVNNAVWQYKNEIFTWRNYSESLMKYIPEGKYTASGVPFYSDRPGPDRFEMHMGKSKNYLTFSPWVGTIAPMWLDYDNDYKRFTITHAGDWTQYFEGPFDSKEPRFAAVGFLDNYTFIQINQEVPFDLETLTFNFKPTMTVIHPITSAETDVVNYVGFYARNKISGTFDGAYSQLYKDLTLTFGSAEPASYTSTLDMVKDNNGFYRLPDGKPRQIIYVDSPSPADGLKYRMPKK